jgi:hypothetical protein
MFSGPKCFKQAQNFNGRMKYNKNENLLVIIEFKLAFKG